MRKLAAALAAAALTMGVAPLLSAAVAHADISDCPKLARVNDFSDYNKCVLANSPPRSPASQRAPTPPPAAHPTYPPPSSVPAQAPQAPPPTVPVQAPQVVPPSPPPATTVPVVTPKINPPAPGAPRNASLVTPPKRLDAPPEAVAAAKAAPATRVTSPPKAPQGDFNQQVQNVVSAHGGNVDVVKVGDQALVRPRHWDYVDYDVYHRPTLYNPLTQAMTFRYFYDSAYREVYLPAGGRTVLDVATVGVFPFTAVSADYVASGSFTGGAWIPPDGWSGPPPPDYTPPPDPTVYQDVSADVPADNQTVQVGQVKVVGHDDSQPAGSQDTFLLDDSTLAWGQVNDPNSPNQITVTKTQSLPGVGPTDNGSVLVALAAHGQPTDNTWWPWALGGGVLVLAAGVVAWVVRRSKRDADLDVSA
jgi:hypothetical protein